MNCAIYDLFQTILGLSDQKRYALMRNVARSRDVKNVCSLVRKNRKENVLKVEA
jgi:hypothetical protein